MHFYRFENFDLYPWQKYTFTDPYFDFSYENDILYVRKVSSGFEYFLLIFALRLGLILKVVGLDAGLNSLSNGGILKSEGGGGVRVLLILTSSPLHLI
jgi:hypothetical protein